MTDDRLVYGHNGEKVYGESSPTVRVFAPTHPCSMILDPYALTGQAILTHGEIHTISAVEIDPYTRTVTLRY